MFYFHNPLMNTTVPTFTPPAITRTVEPQGSPPSTTTPPAGWQWASDHKSRDHKGRSATAHCAASTGSGGDEVKGKKKALTTTRTETPPAPHTATSSGGDGVKGKTASLPAWQPPKGYVRWNDTDCHCQAPAAKPDWQPPKGYVRWTSQTRQTSQPRTTTAASPQIECVPDPAKQVATWNVVSWNNIAPRTITGTRKEAVTRVESDLAAAGIQPLSVQVYPGIHTIVALQGKDGSK